MMGEKAKMLLEVRELADLIKMPEDHYHYKMTGTWKPNQDVFQVNEGDGVISDYRFPEKADMSVVQFASRKTYVREVNAWGNVKDKKVEFDRKSGKWKKLNFFQEIKSHFHKVDNIPGQVVEEDGKFVLHTLEAKRPVGNNVKEAEVTTLQDAKVELGMKYKYAEQKIRDLLAENSKLASVKREYEARIRALNARLIASNLSAIHFTGRSDEPPTYGNITPTQETRKTTTPPERTPPKKDEKLDKRGDEVIRQFEENVKRKEEQKQAEEAKLDEEYKKWIANHPDKAYYELSGEPYPSKAEYVEIKKREEAERKAARDAEERGLAKD